MVRQAVFYAALGAVAAACSGSSNTRGDSALGESCTRTADCRSGLVCIANTCLGSAPAHEAGGADGAADAISVGSPVDGGVDAPGEPGRSLIGETCQTTRDCAPGLDCVPSVGGASVCDLVSYGVTASSKTCTGECAVASDCCALPSGLGISGTTDAGIFVSAQNCEDILLLLLGGSVSVCATHPPPGTSAANACFFYQTYCNCTANTWACNSGRCVYADTCQATLTNTLGGCPSFTRTRSALNTTCETPANKCHAASSGCVADADCEGSRVSDEVGVTCRGGDCACYMSACYLKCAKDLDCQTGYSCDATKKLCSPSACSNDAQCFSQLGKARAKCKKGACGIPCTVDHDCSPSGDIPGQPFNGTVCGPDGVCTPVGCTSDTDCSGPTVTGTRLFCVSAPVMNGVHSAIAN
jgi:hypothetical protein